MADARYLDRLAEMRGTAPRNRQEDSQPSRSATSHHPSSPFHDAPMSISNDTDFDFGFSDVVHMPTPHDTTSNPIDAVLSRQLLERVIDFFLAYFYPLVPLPHRPALMRDLKEHREERAGEEEWTTMIFGIIAFTVVQAPCQKLSLSKIEARDLVELCCQAIGRYLAVEYTDSQATCTRCKSVYRDR